MVERKHVGNERRLGETNMVDRIVLVTGGNKGLGFETARRLKALGCTVYIGARDSARGQTAAATLGVGWLQLDVTDEGSVSRAAAALDARARRLDILVNNAGVAGPRKGVADLTGEDAEAVFATNLIGPIRVIHAFLPLLAKSSAPVIVNVSSGLGSFAATHDESRIESKVAVPLYSVSKAGLTMLTTQYAKALPHIRINAADPGYTATDLNDHRGAQSVEEGTDAIVQLATLPPDGPTGTFVDRQGNVGW
jgi:NAD(P)-dependent dehydrogenase (short-subunit alcohol dehydrogenase family)